MTHLISLTMNHSGNSSSLIKKATIDPLSRFLFWLYWFHVFYPQSNFIQCIGREKMTSSKLNNYKSRFENWNKNEVKLLTDLWLYGMPSGFIAKKLNRSPNAIKIKAMRLGLESRKSQVKITRQRLNPNGKLRPCLSCKNLFYSEGRGNRICDSCKSTSRWKSGSDLSMR